MVNYNWKWPNFWLGIILFWLIACYCFSLFAETIELKNGKMLKGHILIQDQASIYLETIDGTTNINKSDIRAIDGKDYETPASVRRPEESKMTQELVASSTLPPEKEEESKTVADEVQSDVGKSEQDLTSQPAKQDLSLTLPQVMKAVPFIKTKATALDKHGKEFQVEGLGSGAIINANGTILTNAHVIEGAKSVTVTLYQDKDIGQRSKREYEARVIKEDATYDLALIDIHAETPDYLRFAKDSEIKLGDEARACGNPNGLQVSFSKGIISAIRTNKERFASNGEFNELIKEFLKRIAMSEREFNAITWIQTDAAINPGNSGGPLLNANNQILGINSWKSVLPDGQIAEGLGFALHVKHLKKFAAGYYKE